LIAFITRLQCLQIFYKSAASKKCLIVQLAGVGSTPFASIWSDRLVWFPDPSLEGFGNQTTDRSPGKHQNLPLMDLPAIWTCHLFNLAWVLGVSGMHHQITEWCNLQLCSNFNGLLCKFPSSH